MAVERSAGYIFCCNDGVEYAEVKVSEGVFFKQAQGFLPYSFAAMFRRDVHAYRRTPVPRIKIKEIDAT